MPVFEGPSLIIVAFLFPLALYFFALGLINSRRRPLMISGPWDFAGVLFAASGFLTFGLPAILTGLSERWRFFWWTGQLFGGSITQGMLVWVLNIGLVLGLAGVVLWRRRNQTAVYNIEPFVLEEALTSVLDGLGLLWSQCGQDIFIRRPQGQPAQLVSSKGTFFDPENPQSTPPVGESAQPLNGEPLQLLCLELDAAPSLSPRHPAMGRRRESFSA